MGRIITLEIVEPDPRDSVLKIDRTNIYTGHEPEYDIACGGCGELLFRSLSPATLPMDVVFRTTVRCVCGGYNLLPARGSGELIGG